MRGRLSISPFDPDVAIADPVSTVIAIPVSGTSPGLLHCLRSLGRQRCAPRFGVILLLQNCGPATLRLVRALVGFMPYRLRLIELDVRGAEAHSGWARRLAMDAAAQWLEDEGRSDGVILTIDPDAVLRPDWLELNQAALDRGADCVVGGVDHATADGRRLPAAQQRLLRLEAEYAVLLARIRNHFDPAARESAGRHALASTGSLAVHLRVYRSAGRIAPVSQGARRALAEAVEASGGRVRYAAGVRVLLPARRDAARVMPKCEPVTAAVRRAQWRARLRQFFESGKSDRGRVGPADMPHSLTEEAMRAPNFAAAWRIIENGSPILHQAPPTPAALPAEIAAAQKVLAALTAKETLGRSVVAPVSDLLQMRVSQLIVASAMRMHAQPMTA